MSTPSSQYKYIVFALRFPLKCLHGSTFPLRKMSYSVFIEMGTLWWGVGGHGANTSVFQHKGGDVIEKLGNGGQWVTWSGVSASF